MDDNTAIISNFCKNLGAFCKHLQSSSTALKDSLERRPIPLDSASSTFIQCMNRRVSTASNDLNFLESMACGTVSFEELLGHCNEVYKQNRSDLVELEHHLKNYGYVPTDDEEDEVSGLKMPRCGDFEDELGLRYPSHVPHSAIRGTNSIARKFEDDSLCDESLSLQSLGLSDVCLATIASEVNGDDINISPLQMPSNYNDESLLRKEVAYPPRSKVWDSKEDESACEPKEVVATKTMISISRDGYENLHSFMEKLSIVVVLGSTSLYESIKPLVPGTKGVTIKEDIHNKKSNGLVRKDLVAVVEKMNLTLNNQDRSKERNLFYQEELASLALGPKVRWYLVMLLRMNRVVVETVHL